MVSLAFVLSFVASAVVLLIGIGIYTDVTDAMALTIPTLDEDGSILLGQNGDGTVQVIPTGTANLASTYTGLDSFDKVTGVTIPISGIVTGGGGAFNVTSFSSEITKGGDPSHANNGWAIGSTFLMPNGDIIEFPTENSGSAIIKTNSSDGGNTFTSHQIIPDNDTFHHASTIVDDSNIYLLWINGTQFGDPNEFTGGNPLTQAFLAKSIDNGRTFGSPVLIDTLPYGFCDTFEIDANGSTVVVVGVRCDDGEGGGVIPNPVGNYLSEVVVWTSTNGGATFGSATQVAGTQWESTTCVGCTTELSTIEGINVAVVDSSNYVISMVADDGIGSGNVNQYFVSTSNGGTTWSVPVLLNNEDEIEGFEVDNSPANIFVSGSKVTIHWLQFPLDTPVVDWVIGQSRSLDSGSTFTVAEGVIDFENGDCQSDAIDMRTGIDQAGSTENILIVCPDQVDTVWLTMTNNLGETWSPFQVLVSGITNSAGSVSVTCTANNVYLVYDQSVGLDTQLNFIWSDDLAATFSAPVTVATNMIGTSDQVVILGSDSTLDLAYRQSVTDLDVLVHGIGTGGGGVIPKPYHVGIYDSGYNLLDAYSDSVTTDTPQDIVALFSIIPVPNDGIVNVVIYGEDINYLGDTTTADFDSGLSGLPADFVSDGTSASSQRTILHIFHPAQNSVDELGQVDSFERTKSIGFTVLGVMPVALFFAIFTILSPRVDDE